jgi:hypothetical protein
MSAGIQRSTSVRWALPLCATPDRSVAPSRRMTRCGAAIAWSRRPSRHLSECRFARPMKVKAFAEIFRGASACDRHALPGVSESL